MNITAYHLAAYGAGLAMTLVLASYLTPRGWWRRPTVRNLALVGAGTWALGALLLHAFLAPVSANSTLARAAPIKLQGVAPNAAEIVRAAEPMPAAGEPFRVHRALNLRADASTNSERLATVPAGSLVTPTGERRGDWWQVRAHADGREQTGWASSLWLRRKFE
jgi:hypothetical protein